MGPFLDMRRAAPRTCGCGCGCDGDLPIGQAADSFCAFSDMLMMRVCVFGGCVSYARLARVVVRVHCLLVYGGESSEVEGKKILRPQTAELSVIRRYGRP